MYQHPENIALGKPAISSSRYGSSTGGEKAVDGKKNMFNTKREEVPHWWMVDFESTYPVVKMFMLSRGGDIKYKERVGKLVITIGMLKTV